jgi:predicted transposase YdaD
MTTQEINDLESTFDTVASEILDALRDHPEYALIKVKFDLVQTMIQKAIGEKFPDSWLAEYADTH